MLGHIGVNGENNFVFELADALGAGQSLAILVKPAADLGDALTVHLGQNLHHSFAEFTHIGIMRPQIINLRGQPSAVKQIVLCAGKYGPGHLINRAFSRSHPIFVRQGPARPNA